ncbi:L-aspartate oxidase [Pseudoflavonifractor phocaeensis]|uniref:L-aspartate oxidase n=1 Tax=Pseudoflavonifractor phocaeensis TaxID=1870988 RepID=UPI00195E53F8|nr:L-aspartate oxidase [Pseudoflavonifractor phocaeensis]MBM6939694.1 L-aspartate oxidase [Pseudoflavonifractor phocaeensis]
MEQSYQAVIVGTGVAGLFCSLHLPRHWPVLLITKSDLESSDSFLAQGGICMLRDESDYAGYFEDTMKAGHYENRAESVELMIRNSQSVIRTLVGLGVDFAREADGSFRFTREGAHSRPRILFHQDVTGQEITSKLLAEAKRRPNLTLLEYTAMVDLLVENGQCSGILAQYADGSLHPIRAEYTILASGGIGGRYVHSTNFPHLTGDALDIAARYGIRLEHLDYVQFHPTTLYSTKPGRRFLISESVRGEGAVLYNHNMERFVNELLPRDLVTAAIRKEMEREKVPFVWLSMAPIPKEDILSHFPNIYRHCLEEGYDVTRQCIPVVPAQHYFMGGIWVDRDSKTSMDRLFAVGETSCNGVHGANRLASNSLLESLVFARRAANAITSSVQKERTSA